MTRALVVGAGGLRGAYDAGVLATLCRKLGPDYFDGVYASSAGSFAATFYVANQPDVIEHVWRDLVHGTKLVDYLNPLFGRNIMDLEYLIEIFTDGESRLDIDAVIRNPARLTYVLTDYSTGTPTYHFPSKDNIFNLLTATAAVPLLHKPVTVGSKQYTDGELSDTLPVIKAISDGYDEVVAVYNKPEGFYVGERYDLFTNLISFFLPPKIAGLVRTLKKRTQQLERDMFMNKRINIIRPAKQLPLVSILDTKKERLNETFDQGVRDAEVFLK
ncbi:MAG: patatin-like phospholipase family protein [Parcubacteria group bacterium]